MPTASDIVSSIFSPQWNPGATSVPNRTPITAVQGATPGQTPGAPQTPANPTWGMNSIQYSAGGRTIPISGSTPFSNQAPGTPLGGKLPSANGALQALYGGSGNAAIMAAPIPRGAGNFGATANALLSQMGITAPNAQQVQLARLRASGGINPITLSNQAIQAAYSSGKPIDWKSAADQLANQWYIPVKSENITNLKSYIDEYYRAATEAGYKWDKKQFSNSIMSAARQQAGLLKGDDRKRYMALLE